MRQGLIALAVGLTLAGCSDEDGTDISDVAGSYEATTFVVTPDGEGQIDVLAAGGFINITINSNGTTTGDMFLPASVAGTDQAFSMDGTASIVGSEQVAFDQVADSFFRELTFTIEAEELVVLEQRAGSAVFTITLTRD
jgi:hypothetical protein